MSDAGKIGEGFASLILNLVATCGFFLLSLTAYLFLFYCYDFWSITFNNYFWLSKSTSYIWTCLPGFQMVAPALK